MPDIQPRGIRNNNPGNIRKGTGKWQGLDPIQKDSEFCTFISPVWGIRAMAIILRNYQTKHGLYTITNIINRWAPPHGDRNGPLPGGEYTQDTSSYAAHVAKCMGKSVDDIIVLSDIPTIFKLITAMIDHENGQQPYDGDTIMQALKLAGINKP